VEIRSAPQDICAAQAKAPPIEASILLTTIDEVHYEHCSYLWRSWRSDGDPGEAAASFQLSHMWAFPVSDVLARLRQAIEAAALSYLVYRTRNIDEREALAAP
jgi:hypothetical protein